MLLQKLSVVKLHSALTLDVVFNDEITLLVGINGSGKTSVLNAIEVLLRPDMRKLATMNYERLSLTLEEKGVVYDLSATKTATLVTLKISGGATELSPITIDLLEHVNPEDDEATAIYSTLALEEHERPMWDLLQSFPKPTIISLDRTIAAESDETQYIDPGSVRSRPKARARSPLAHVQQVTSAKYAEYRSKAIANEDELKAQIVMSALQDPDVFSDGHSIKAMTKSEITKLEEKVVTYLSRTIKSGEVSQQVQNFFRSARIMSQRQNHLPKNQQDLVLDFVASRYRQIESLAKAFNDYETKNGRAFGSLRAYLSTINRFFNDSNKTLYFDESTGRLMFSFVSDGIRQLPGRAIRHLSSGERQVLILFTFLAFASNPEAVFIVDEPELSLHPKWQHEFMDAFLSLRPPTAQLLLATHSPDIVGKFRAACVTLRSRGL